MSQELFVAAIKANDVDIAGAILKKAGKKDKERWLAGSLELAARKGHLAMLDFLIENGAKPDYLVHEHLPPTSIYEAYTEAEKGVDCVPVLARLLKAKANPESYSVRGGRRVLDAAAAAGNLRVVKFLLENKADSKKVDHRNGGGTALSEATKAGHSAVIRVLQEDIRKNEGKQTTSIDMVKLGSAINHFSAKASIQPTIKLAPHRDGTLLARVIYPATDVGKQAAITTLAEISKFLQANSVKDITRAKVLDSIGDDFASEGEWFFSLTVNQCEKLVTLTPVQDAKQTLAKNGFFSAQNSGFAPAVAVLGGPGGPPQVEKESAGEKPPKVEESAGEKPPKVEESTGGKPPKVKAPDDESPCLVM